MNEGRIEQVDEPSRIYSQPRNRFVANFIGNCTMLDSVIVAQSGQEMRLDVAQLGQVVVPRANGATIGQRGTFALRPEQARIVPAQSSEALANRFAGRVRDFLYIGDVTTYVVELENGTRIDALLANSAPGRARFFEPGEPVAVTWPHDAGMFLAS
jgi:spermidine/putrescine transport system ATP-binding protein